LVNVSNGQGQLQITVDERLKAKWG